MTMPRRNNGTSMSVRESPPSSPPSVGKRPLSSRVTFCPTAKMRLTLHINDYTNDEIDASYYSREDYSGFRQDVKSTIDLMDVGAEIKNIHCNPKQSECSDVCERGADHYTKEAIKTRFSIRRATYSAVFKAQDAVTTLSVASNNAKDEKTTTTAPAPEQKTWWMPEEHQETGRRRLDTAIAKAYVPYSLKSATSAYLRGLSDEREVNSGIINHHREQDAPTMDWIQEDSKQNSVEVIRLTSCLNSGGLKAPSRWQPEPTPTFILPCTTSLSIRRERRFLSH